MSQMCVEALTLGPSSLTADPFGPLLDEDEERSLSAGSSSPLSSSSCLSPLSPSPHASVGCKDLQPLSWTTPSELEQSKAGDVFSGMDWMAEKLDLSDFDLDSLIGSCDSDEPPSSPEDLLACLDTDMDLDLDSLPFCSSDLGLALTLDLPIPEPSETPVEIKSEPDPADTLDLGCEVSVIPSPGIVLSLSPSHIIVVLSPKEESSGTDDSSDSDSGISVCESPTRQPDPNPTASSRTKPYSRTDPDPVVSGRVKAVPGAPKVEKKLKKMEQNKTAATRYRQKKRAEQEVLSLECSGLEKRNRELAEKAESISRKIKYLTDLMEEVRSAKNRRSKAKAGSG
ncbi:hypothetical protein R3I93_009600 [Phoxinus phoxinus]|uniref:Cyclic AMP-dependent transcription factor ATF-4 n=1 Tax=Phoxinus phoxinus TaxID=58324 RepID=A0AAN9H4H5_9TELE